MLRPYKNYGMRAGRLMAVTRRLNFIGILARRYKPPELLRFLDDLAQGLRVSRGLNAQKGAPAEPTEARNPRLPMEP